MMYLLILAAFIFAGLLLVFSFDETPKEKMIPSEAGEIVREYDDGFVEVLWKSGDKVWKEKNRFIHRDNLIIE